MPRKPAGERALTGAEREAKRRQRIRQDRALADEALAFLLALPEPETYSMTWENKRQLKDLQVRARIKRAESLP